MPESTETQEIDLEFIHGMQNYIEIHQTQAAEAVQRAVKTESTGFKVRNLIRASQHAAQAQGCAYVLKHLLSDAAKRKAGVEWNAAEQIHIHVRQVLRELWSK